MRSTLEKRIKALVEELYPAEGVERGIDWKGYKVYEPIYDKNLYIGYPYVILVKGEKARICTVKESLEYLNYKNNNSNFQKSTNLLDGKLSD